MTGHSEGLMATKLLIKKIVKNQNSEEELDGLYLVCGEEGSGKSNTILTVTELWEEETSKHLSINNIARNLKELFTELKIHSKFCVALDEGYELKATNMWDQMVKKIEKAYMIGRYRANLSLIAYTNPFKINSYFKEDRAKGIFFCYKRRIVLYYNREDLREIRNIMNKAGNIKSINDLYEIDMYRNRATFIEYGVEKYKGHLAEEYKKRKIENYVKEMEEMEDDVDVVTYSMNKTMKILGVSDGTIRKCIEAKVIEPEWNATGTKMRLRQEDIDKLKVYLKPQERQ
jgi:energy-coupling factor transporter ATP-binding protein EcfA2